MGNKQNYTAKMELTKKHKLAAGLISDRFPKVAGIVLYMTYYQEGVNPILMLRTVNIFPTDSAYFKMECMTKGCIEGGFNLTTPIIDLIKKRKNAGKGELTCRGKHETRSSCRAKISYDIKIKYKK